ncbi:MAG: glycosyltransferase family 2 protein [Waddliaceae bacterium]
MSLLYSIVIPLKNEEGNISLLIQEVEEVMNGLQKPWELICIDDGSTDQTLPILKDLSKNKPFLKVIAFNKNYGQSSAFAAGFEAAKGEYVITLDGDRQNDPRDIPMLIDEGKGYDLVCGRRKKRKDTLVKRLTSKLANALRNYLLEDPVKDTGCSLKIYKKSCLQKIKMYNGMHRFLPALFSIEGFSIKEVDVNHRPRTEGQTKYNFFNRSFNTIADLLAVRWMRKRVINYRIKNG